MKAIKTHTHELWDRHVRTCRDITVGPGNTEKAEKKLSVTQGGATKRSCRSIKYTVGKASGGSVS